MPQSSVPKYEVACELLDCAIRLYLEADYYYSALHLAGGAEEIFGIYARSTEVSPGTKMIPAFDSFKSAMGDISHPSGVKVRNELEKWAGDRMNAAKNSVKHKYGVNDRTVEFDPIEEAAELIDRAITTYSQLVGVLPLPYILRISEYDAQRRQARDGSPRDN